MEIVTTHVGADFDALASVLLARKLHPEARVFFPGSKEESVRRLLEGPFGRELAFPELKAREIDPAELTRVVLCDVVQRDRIGVVARWLEEHPGIEVWAYDHHDPSEDDLAPAGGRVDPGAGSTATILAELLGERGVALSSLEATLLLLGIYEDTGSLSYAGTGPRELRAAARLLEAGGDLGLVRRFALQRLDPGRFDILHRMTETLEVRRIHGQPVGVLALELGDFVDELAPLVNRCLEIFELPLLFAIFGEGDRVTLIARGDAPGVHLGRLLEGFAEGGGHPTAASARLKGVTPLETRERLLAFLERSLPPSARAADLMATGFFTLEADATVRAAKERLLERRINAAPVVDSEGRVFGVVTRQTLDGALQHGLGERRVETVADRDLEWVDPDAPAEEVGERMLRRHPRLVLVGDPALGRPRGLVTRMQVLRHLHSRLRAAGSGVERRIAHLPEERAPIGALLRERLPESVHRRLERIAAVSRRAEIPVYLVGGIVRDLLLDRENRDLDLVVEGDGPHFARLLAEELGGRVRVHEAFLTAVVVDPEGFHVDVATARSEFYRAPAALPEVQTSPLRQDLFRRDFTINALAVRLGPEPGPELIDYFGGRRDLENRLLRVLHSLSFIDDPTRVLRAVRLGLRLGFEISPETLHLVGVALSEGVFDRLSGARLREELILLLDDPALAVRGLERLEGLGVLRALHPALSLEEPSRSHGERLRRAVAAWDWYTVEGLSEPPAALWRLVLLALAQGGLAQGGAGGREEDAGGLPPEAVRELADRLMLSGDDREVLTGGGRRLEEAALALRRPGVRPHEVSEALARLSGEELLLLVAAEDEAVRDWARRELSELRPLELGVRGRDLVERGFPPGRRIGEALEAVRRARLDGEIGPDEELAAALAFLEERSTVPAGEPAGAGP
ncbi:MAG TPA: CBS domain-containing protein [Thermoanaerobaculia bacterium]|nr:CBS domain-containing protein [Thermoanaerobaculia bacterium]